jgi:hypothetical protein
LKAVTEHRDLPLAADFCRWSLPLIPVAGAESWSLSLLLLVSLSLRSPHRIPDEPNVVWPNQEANVVPGAT